MNKIDLKKQYKSYYTAKTKPEIVDLEEVKYISVIGKGDPSEEDFAKKIQALYSVAYALKFMCKTQNKDYVVPKLEAQWHFDDSKYHAISMEKAPKIIPRSEWNYRLLIRQPEFVLQEFLDLAIENVLFKKKLELAKNVKWFTIPAGSFLQILHLGPFDSETVSLNKMLDFMQDKNLRKNGHHHEIYLSDFRKTAPEKLKTILREPVCVF
jgi:hypothetical protein